MIAALKTIEPHRRLALREVRDGKLYKANYGTFEEYCERRWKFKDNYARKLIGASTAALELPESERPKTEGESRKSFKISQKTGTRVPVLEKKSTAIRQDETKIMPREIEVEMPEDLCDANIARIEKARSNRGFQKALKEWLDEKQ